MKLCMGCMNEIDDHQNSCPYCGYKANTPIEQPYYLKPGTVIKQQYIVGKVLGYGGFGITYIGRDTILRRTVAIKEYLPSECATRMTNSQNVIVYSGDAGEQYQSGLVRFISEAKRLAQFNHIDGVVSIYDCIQENQTGYIIMEYLEGQTIKEVLSQGCNYTYWEAERIILDVLNVLSDIHKQGIIHRDIAPDNIFITDKGEVKLIDFGAARYTVSSKSKSLSVILKKGYAPEEQYRSHGEQGPWTDVYGAGATFYRMITGILPEEALERMVKDSLIPPSKMGVNIPPYGEKVLLTSLGIYKEDRYQTAKEFYDALLQGQTLVGNKSSTKTKHSYKISTGIFAAFAVVILGLIFAKVQLNHKTVTGSITTNDSKKNQENIKAQGNDLPILLPTETPTPTSFSVPDSTTEPVSTSVPTLVPTAEPVPSNTPIPSPTVVPIPSSTPTPLPTAVPEPSNPPVPSPTAAPVPSNTPTPLPTAVPVSSNTPAPSPTAVPAPSNTPAPSPTVVPVPSNTPSPSPSSQPTAETDAGQYLSDILLLTTSDGREKRNMEIVNKTENKIKKLQINQAGSDVIEAEYNANEPSQASFDADAGRLYDIYIFPEAELEYTTFVYYGLNLWEIKKIQLYIENNYTYTVYETVDGEKINNKQYRVKTYGTPEIRYVNAVSGVQIRKLPDNVVGDKIGKLTFAQEVKVYGEAKGLISEKEADWYLVKQEASFGFISAQYAANEKIVIEKPQEQPQQHTQAQWEPETVPSTEYYPSESGSSDNYADFEWNSGGSDDNMADFEY